MKLEDIKVGDVVTAQHCPNNGDYTVEYIHKGFIILDVQHRTTSCWNTPLKNTLWAVEFTDIEKVVDPEEDLIVWGALDAGEKFQIEGISSTTYLKLNATCYVVLGSSSLRQWIRPSHWKVQLVD